MKKLPVEVTGITNCAPYQGYVVILKELNGKRWLPIFIGAPEAHNISLLLQGMRYIRPLTYDLFANLLEAAETRIDSITVTDLKDNTFYAEVCIRLYSGELREVDARPSDAIALAIKSKAAIFVNTAVFEEAGLIGDVSSQSPEFNDRLDNLNKQLKEAVDQEAYEEAAKLRDQIKAIEEQVQSS